MRRAFTALPFVLLLACSSQGTPSATLSQIDSFLLAATKIGLPAPGVSLDNLPAGDSLGAATLVGYCGQCHAVPAPATHSAGDWPIVLRRMWLRMDHLSRDFRIQLPTTGERHALLAYLRTHALIVADILPDLPGRETFQLVCSQCHALPDPRAHSPADWPVVFLRMRENMSRMQVAPPDQAETSAVLGYLERSTLDEPTPSRR